MSERAAARDVNPRRKKWLDSAYTLRNSDNVSACAQKAKYVTNVEVKAAICDLKARVINPRQTAAKQRHVTVPIKTAVTMNNAFWFASTATGVYVIR